MHLYVLLACVLWGLESHSVPMKIVPASPQKNYTEICGEIQKELLADHAMYHGPFNSPQNTSEEPCYGEFTKNFISTLKNLSKLNKKDDHINKIYKDMEELISICSKLKPTKLPKKCIIEQSNFLRFKEALRSVVISIEGWTSCDKIKGGLWDPVLSREPGAHG